MSARRRITIEDLDDIRQLLATYPAPEPVAVIEALRREIAELKSAHAEAIARLEADLAEHHGISKGFEHALNAAMKLLAGRG